MLLINKPQQGVTQDYSEIYELTKLEGILYY